MSGSLEQAYYDNPEIWTAEAYLGEDNEMRRFRLCADLLPPGTARLLDVGTGNGAFLRVLEEVKPEVEGTGLERARAAIDRALCRAPIVEGSSDRLPFEDRSFDVVSALEVVEHLPFGIFERSLQEMARVARGHVLLSVPYRENRLRVECPYCGCGFNPFFHLRRFDAEVMRGLVPGFTCVRLERVHAPDLLFSPVLRRAWRWVRARGGYFPNRAVCPQCGYSARAASPAAAVANGAPAQPPLPAPRRSRALRAASTVLPRRSRAKWIVGLYRRPEQNA